LAILFYLSHVEREKIEMSGSDTARKGLATQFSVALELVEKGYEVLQPLEDLRYDLACYIPSEDRWIRVQCKTAWLSKDQSCLVFNTSNIPGGRGKRKSYQGEVEYFGVYSSNTSKAYLVPVDDVPYVSRATLRLKSTKNNQEKRVIWAKDYEL
jgi:PD-(D/E)XK endonuclease